MVTLRCNLTYFLWWSISGAELLKNIDALASALKHHSFDMKQNADGNMVRELFVFYYNSGNDHWWNRFLRRGFEHCALVTHDGSEYTLVSHGVVNNYHQALPIMPGVDEATMIKLIKDTFRINALTVQKVCCTIKPVNRLKFPVVIDSCVENTKRYLGIGKRSIMTPYQLYKHLRQYEV